MSVVSEKSGSVDATGSNVGTEAASSSSSSSSVVGVDELSIKSIKPQPPLLPQPLEDCNIYYKNILLCNPDDGAIVEVISQKYMPILPDPVEVEAVETKVEKGKAVPLSKQASTNSNSNPTDTENETENQIKSDCIIVDSVVVYCCGGRGVFDEVMIPPDTVPGQYVLLMKDGVDEHAYNNIAATTVTDDDISVDPEAPPPAEEVINSLPHQLIPGNSYIDVALNMEYNTSCNVALLAPPNSLEQMFKVISKLPDMALNRILVIPNEGAV